MRLPVLSFVYDRKKRASAKRPASVEFRMTYMGKQKYMSTGVHLLPKQWRNGMVTNRADAVELNKTLETLRSKVTNILNAMIEEGNIDLNEVPIRLERESGGGQTFLEFCEERSTVRKYGRSKDSQERYDRFMRFFKSWGKIRYFSDITDRNILLMDEVLVKKGMQNYSKWNNYHRFLNSYILDAIAAGLLKRNPYKWVHIEKDKKSHGIHKYLTLDEVRRLETAKMPTDSLEKVRDLFVFQIYTCLSYKDLASFDIKKAIKRADGRMVYTGNRAKTNEGFTFLILEPAMKVLKKYGNRLPMLSNVKYNEYLKVVAQSAGIDKPITSHWARHTGATIMLNEGVDMETVSKILGHSSTRITRQVYAKLLDSTVVDKMLEVEKKIK